jgi:hypothetical protein
MLLVDTNLLSSNIDKITTQRSQPQMIMSTATTKVNRHPPPPLSLSRMVAKSAYWLSENDGNNQVYLTPWVVNFIPMARVLSGLWNFQSET